MKRLLAFILALIMTLSLCPVTALAELVPETYEVSGSYVYNGDLGYTDEEAFAAYFQRELDKSLGYETPATYSTCALEEGTGERDIYDALKIELAEIAAGTTGSAEIALTLNQTYTKEELGVVGAYVSNGKLSEETAKAIENILLNKVYICLLVDCPMELYWHDKTKGVKIAYGYSTSGENLTITQAVYYFCVATDYSVNGAADTYVTDTTKTHATTTAINNAKAIVNAAADKNDLEKLQSYKDTICSWISYNETAAESGSSANGINPWQMIYVFDGDYSTNVVCEGYAKAFQYLCDLSAFSGGIECHTVQGVMSGGTGAGNHMWNVVTMDDGKNYLVDVTNCDSGTIGADNKLFMAYTDNSANNNQTHTFTIDSQNITFTYSDDMADLFCDGYLALSETAYTGPILEAAATFSGNTDSLYPGDVVTLTLSFDGTNIAGIEATLNFDDTLLEFVSAECPVGGTMDTETLKFVMGDGNTEINAATDVLKVTLKVKENATSGAELAVSFKEIVVTNGTKELDVADAAWTGSVAASEARWGLATGTDSNEKPASWTYGTLTDAVTYANGLTFGTAYIQLRSDVWARNTIFVAGKTNILDLNGHTVNRTQGGNYDESIFVINGYLTLCDTSTDADGMITGGYTQYYGGAISVNGVFTMNGGTISDNYAGALGAGVYVSSSGTFIMNGGTISNNNGASSGGGVYVGNGTFIMSGGTISGNVANSGAGVYIGQDGFMAVSGSAVVTKNHRSAPSYSKSNIFLHRATPLVVNAVLAADATFGITISGDGYNSITGIFSMPDGTSLSDLGSYINRFSSDNADYMVVEEGGNLKLVSNSEARWGLATGTDSNEKPDTWLYGTLTEAVTYSKGLTAGTAYIQLLDNIVIDAPVVIKAGKRVVLDLNGKALDRGLSEATEAADDGNVISVYGDLTICDTSDVADGKITGAYLNSGETLNGAVFVNYNGSLVMTGGTICGNKIIGDGSGVYVYRGTFTMSGGMISNNTATEGGGVYVTEYGTFSMTGDAIISKNAAQNGGGGVYLEENASFTMKGGTISSNETSDGSGGGVRAKGNFTMSGGTISGNTAKYVGGGVSADGGSITVSSAPVISGNTKFTEPETVSNVYLAANQTIAVADALSTNASIGVTTASDPTSSAPVTVATGSSYTLTTGDAAKFTSDNGHLVELDSTNNVLQLVKPIPPVVGLNTTSGSMNLFQETALTIPVECNYDFAGARFKDYATSAVFDISLGENGTLQITPKEKPEEMTWAEWGKEVAGSYKSAIEIEYIRGQYVTTSDTLTIKLTATAPKVTATAVKFNSFISGDTQSVVLTTNDGVVASVSVDESKTTDKAPACPTWITLNDDLTATLINDELVNKKGSGKLNLEVWLEGWRAPAQVAVSVSVVFTAPKLKLSATSLNLSNNTVPEGVPLTLLSADKKLGLTDLNVVSLRAATNEDLTAMGEKDHKTYAGSTAVSVADFDSETGAFNLTVEHGKLVNGKVLLIATIAGAATDVTIPLTIKVIDRATLKASTTKITLNTAMGTSELRDEKIVTFSTNAQGFWFGAGDAKITDTSGAACGRELDVTLIKPDSGELAYLICANENTVENKTYRLNVYVEGSTNATKPLVITITAKATLPAVKLNTKSITLHKSKGIANIDVIGLDGYDIESLIVDAPSEVNVSGDSEALSVNLTNKAVVGRTYKVNVSYELTCGLRTKPVAITVKAVNAITATATVKGNMDVTRPYSTSSTFTFKYTGWYPGDYVDAAYNPELVWEVYAMNGKMSVGDVTNWFENVSAEPYGLTLQLNTDEDSAWESGEVNPKYTYVVKAKLVFENDDEVVCKDVKMTVKQGSVKFAANTKTVTVAKQTDAVSETFSINKTDKDAVNVADIAKVAVAASKTPSAFEVVETTGGYEIVCVDLTAAKSGTVKLNIWLEGNYVDGCEEIWNTKDSEYRKPNATVSLKVNVVQ